MTSLWILIFVCVILSAFFSASEITFNAANKLRLKKAAETEGGTARLAWRMSENFTTSLSAILIGNNLVNIAASSAATLLVGDLIGGDRETLTAVISTASMTLIILIFGEIIPKILGRQHADRLVRIDAIPVRVITIILYPLVFLVMLLIRLLRKLWGQDEDDEPSVNTEELSTIIDTVEEEGVIDEDKSELLQSTLEFPDTTAEEILTPRIDLVTIDIDDDPASIADTVLSSRYTRIPVYEGSIDNIVGVLVLNRYYKALADCSESGRDETTLDLRSLLIEPQFVYKTMKLPAVLRLMRENKVHLVIVTDEYGGTMGIVTMEDILEELVGDIWDEADEIVQMITATGENTYEVNGDMNIDDFFSEIDFDAEAHDFSCEYSTVGGWSVEMLNDAPTVGDSFTYENLCIIVTEMDDMRVTKLTVLVSPVEESEEEE
ncbi:MAG: hemolysin family protein [Clostridia bacterium]|nr:hemolysin family protein [Clostridia bacterium]